MGLSLVRYAFIYQAIKEAHQEQGYPIQALCKLGGISRAAYYKWLHREIPERERLNQQIAKKVVAIHAENPEEGHRRIRDELERYHGMNVSDKRILRICRSLGIQSIIKYKHSGCTRQAANPRHLAENELGRVFTAETPNAKWLTDVTEFKYYVNGEKRKLYLSAILDLFDRRIVSFVIGDQNNNALVFDTLDQARAAYPDAHPLLHSDRGFQYTNRTFHEKLKAAGMKQSMSRIGKCIDNGPMEGFWGMMKRERYHGRKFTNRASLVAMVEEYISYYNNKRLQRKLGIQTPLEKYAHYLQLV